MSFLSYYGRRSVTFPLPQLTATVVYQIVIGFLCLMVGLLSIVTMNIKAQRDVAQAELRGHIESEVVNGKYVMAFSNICNKILNDKKDKGVAYLPNPVVVK